jgi:carbon-monoxide dehydrogenase medium subunit
MINTRILPDQFEYFEPRTVEEAFRTLATCGKGAKVVAGGTDLLVEMKMGKGHPECLVNISRIPALRYLIEERGLRIGALTSFREIERSPMIRGKYTALYEAAHSVTSVQIKHMGTIGGNLCHASPAADSAPPFIALGGKAKLVAGNQERVLPVEDFFVGPGKTVLSSKELFIEVQLPELPSGTGSSFLKLGRVSADLAKASVAVMIIREGNICKECRIVMGAVAEKPMSARGAEKILIGEKWSRPLVERAGEKVSEEIRPIDDVRSTLWYRKEVSKVLVRDAVELAWERAGT